MACCSPFNLHHIVILEDKMCGGQNGDTLQVRYGREMAHSNIYIVLQCNLVWNKTLGLSILMQGKISYSIVI